MIELTIADIICGAFFVAEAVVTTPSGQRHFPKLEDNRNGTVKIKYQPTEVGLHTLDVTYNQSPVAGSPFKFFVDHVGVGHVTAYGPGLSHGISGQLCHFTIVTKDAGAGVDRLFFRSTQLK